MRHENIFVFTGIVLASALASGTATADQLGKDACAALKTEVATLDATGLKDDMEKGPDWAKANMAPERLQQVARYIELEEQISFRCRVLTVPARKKAVAAKPPAGKDAKAAAATAAPDATATPPATKPKAARRPPQGEAGSAKPKKPQAKTGLFNIE